MFNPLVDNFEKLSDQEIDEKIRKLTSHYYQTVNASVRQQIIVLLDMYQIEAQARQARRYQQQNDNDDLDSLININ